MKSVPKKCQDKTTLMIQDVKQKTRYFWVVVTVKQIKALEFTIVKKINDCPAAAAYKYKI
jgi:hypothetical protein